MEQAKGLPLELEESVKTLPHEPGIYKFFDGEGVIIYIGKAKDLRKRVQSYFRGTEKHNAKTRLLVKKITRLDYIVVNDEKEALLLENSLIKENKPKYNILLKDDKTYPWICITKEEYPRIIVTRRVDRKKGRYFGPYTSSGVIDFMLKNIKSIVPYRTCKLKLNEDKIREGHFDTCLEYHIGRCKGPCVSKESREEYNKGIEQIADIIKGKTKELLEKLEVELALLENELEFERAEKLHAKIEALHSYTAKNTIVNPHVGNYDILSLVIRNGRYMANYMQLTQGTIRLSVNREIVNPLEENPETIIEYLAYHFSAEFASENRQLITNIEKVEKLEEYPIVEHPIRGDKRKLLMLSVKNASNELNRRDKLREIEGNDELLSDIQEKLHLKRLPRRIECIDNSNTLGTYPVSAVVVFINGKPAKSEYRIYHIKTVEGPNDYATMHEVIERRYGKMEIKDLPDLLILDGGKGQLGVGIKTLQEVKRWGYFDLASLAETNEEIYLPKSTEPIVLDKNSDVLRTIIHMRDEAHRFGVKHHTKRRDSDIAKTELEEVSGVGQKTINTLYLKFHTMEKMHEAGLAKLAEEVGLKKAEKVWSYLEEKYRQGE